jgi:Family of unknown function (DUF6167)
MRRLFWLGIGLAVGAVVVRRLTRKAESFTPQGIAQSVADSFSSLAESAREFADEVREGMAEREDELFAALSADADPDAAAAVFDPGAGDDAAYRTDGRY